jgi:cytochrome c
MRRLAIGWPALAAVVIAVAAVLVALGATRGFSGGDSGGTGAALIRSYGCGTCHMVRGIDGADGEVGPPLTGLDKRRMIAGRLPNTPANLARWISQPQAVDPGNAMPDMGVPMAAARIIAAYLYAHA